MNFPDRGRRPPLSGSRLLGAAVVLLGGLCAGCNDDGPRQGILLRLWASEAASLPHHVMITWYRPDGGRLPDRRFPQTGSLKPDGIYLGTVLVEIDGGDGERRVSVRGENALGSVVGLDSKKVQWSAGGFEEVTLRLRTGVPDRDNDGVADDVDDDICGDAGACSDGGPPVDAAVDDGPPAEPDAREADRPIDARPDSPPDRPTDARDARDARVDSRPDGKP